MDKYEILGTIGNGSFGVVHKAKETSTENIVALKIVDKVRAYSLFSIRFMIAL